MLKNITLGQYFPGDTLVHRLDPRTKLILATVYVTALFLARSLLAMGVMAIYLMLILVSSQVKPRLLLRGLRPLIVLLIMTSIINLFATPGEPLFHLWRLTATREGAVWALTLLLRIMMMVTGTFVMTYTTTPMALTDGLEKLLGFLKHIRVPVHEMAMIMSSALRFIPTLIEETDKIISAQKARGADFETGNLFRRAKALLPILIPLFISAFRRADELAIAMESRCYHGGEGRTRMRQLAFSMRDAWAGLIGVLFFAVIIVFRVLGI